MYKVIIADDEPLILFKLKSVFPWRECGFSLIADTTSSEKLLELILTESPQAVFLDINMPKMSGLEIIEKARAAGAKCKFVIISGYADFQYATKAIRQGVFDYLLKPVSKTVAEDVLKRLKQALDEENEISITYKIADPNNPTFNKMLVYIEKHFCEKLYLNELAEKFGINLSYCCTLFNKNLGCSFAKYILKLRMEKAAELLIKTDMSTNEIAEICGYDYFHFSKLFKKYFDMTPKQYRTEKYEQG